MPDDPSHPPEPSRDDPLDPTDQLDVEAVLAEASGLSLPVLDGALKRNTKGRWPHVKRSPHREPLPVQGSAYRYWLSIRGLEYIRERFPELRNQSSNGVYDGEEMLAEEYEPTA